jgi:dihydroneopterin aldolase
MTVHIPSCAIAFTGLETRLRVGIWDHEREFQPVRVNLSLRARLSDGSLDSLAIPRWITDEWPKSAHIPLLETRLRELMQFVFEFDTRIDCVDVALSKPWACREARGVGVRMALSRDEYERMFGLCSPAQALLNAR